MLAETFARHGAAFKRRSERIELWGEAEPIVERVLKSCGYALPARRIGEIAGNHNQAPVARAISECRKLHAAPAMRMLFRPFRIEVLFQAQPAISVAGLQRWQVRCIFRHLLGI